MSKERPILFSGPMVQAILDGRKTQTRRIVKAKDSDPKRCITLSTLMANVLEWRHQDGRWFGIEGYDTLVYADCPYGQVGDRLWVRERFGYCNGVGLTCGAIDATYVCFPDGSQQFRDSKIGYHQWNHPVNPGSWPSDWRWRPSIHMPRWASRIELEITGVRVERLNEISEEDAIAEGCEGVCHCGDSYARHANYDNHSPVAMKQPSEDFRELWEDINGGESWAANPWVWVIEFKRIGA